MFLLNKFFSSILKSVWNSPFSDTLTYVFQVYFWFLLSLLLNFEDKCDQNAQDTGLMLFINVSFECGI
jgi:hypothetical protein